MTLDITKYGFTNIHIDPDRISSVSDPVFVKASAHNAGFTGAYFGTGVEKIVEQFQYDPPIEKMAKGQAALILPHHVIQVTCDGKDYYFPHVNIGWKNKSFGRFDYGTIDPRLEELHKYLLSYMNNDNAVNSSFEGTKDISDDAYQLYLVEKYDIKKNDTLNKFVLNGKPYSELTEVLKVAHELES
jgi:hypothetical protein